MQGSSSIESYKRSPSIPLLFQQLKPFLSPSVQEVKNSHGEHLARHFQEPVTDHLVDLKMSNQQFHHPKKDREWTSIDIPRLRSCGIHNPVPMCCLSPSITLLPRDDQAISTQINPSVLSLFSLFSLHNRLKKE